MPEKTISIIIPAFNEEKNIVDAIDNVVRALDGLVDDYEILVFNDGSRDRTGQLAEEKAKQNPKVLVIHNDTNRGYGYSFQRGIQLATKVYIGVFPGDNDMAWESLSDLVKNIGEADLITSYMEEMEKRSLLRRTLSRMFLFLMNTLFGMKLRYFNGSFICTKERLQSITIKANGLIVLAECLVRLIKSGATYKEVCFRHVGRQNEKSKALHFKSIIAVITEVFSLWCDMAFQKGGR